MPESIDMTIDDDGYLNKINSNFFVIEFHMLDKQKYFPLVCISGIAVRTVLYPLNLIKTRLQVQTSRTLYSGTRQAFRNILSTEGLSGLYSGFLVHNLSIVSQMTFLSSYELVRHLLSSSDLFQSHRQKSFIAGGVASMIAQTVVVPIDVVTQHLQVKAVYREAVADRKQQSNHDGNRNSSLRENVRKSIFSYDNNNNNNNNNNNSNINNIGKSNCTDIDNRKSNSRISKNPIKSYYPPGYYYCSTTEQNNFKSSVVVKKKIKKRSYLLDFVASKYRNVSLGKDGGANNLNSVVDSTQSLHPVVSSLNNNKDSKINRRNPPSFSEPPSSSHNNRPINREFKKNKNTIGSADVVKTTSSAAKNRSENVADSIIHRRRAIIQQTPYNSTAGRVAFQLKSRSNNNNNNNNNVRHVGAINSLKGRSSKPAIVCVNVSNGSRASDLRLLGAFSIVRAIYAERGFRGFYKGFTLSVLTYAPTSAMWWFSYDCFCDTIGQVLPTWVPRLSVQCMAASFSAITTTIMTTPFDAIRARMQVENLKFVGTATNLWREERYRMLTKALAPRLIQNLLTSFFVILGYESIKKFSLLDEYKTLLQR